MANRRLLSTALPPRTTAAPHPATCLGRHAAQRTAATCAAFATIALAAVDAAAFVLPVQLVEGHPFPRLETNVRVAEARIAVERMLRESGQEPGGLWWLDADLRLHNTANSPVTITVVVPDSAEQTEHTQVFVDGVPISCPETRVEFDPTLVAYNVERGRLCELGFDALSGHVVRVSTVVSGSVDNLGVSSLPLSTHLLGAFAEDIASATIAIRLDERAIGLLATLDGATVYDEPVPSALWFARAWEPTLPFEASWLSPWATLLLAAELERCPPPWDIVRGFTGGSVAQTQAVLRTYDAATLEFCAALPLVLHGGPVASAQARAQLATLDVSRYVPGPDRGAIYRENPNFADDLLSEVEGIYRRALLAVLE